MRNNPKLFELVKYLIIVFILILHPNAYAQTIKGKIVASDDQLTPLFGATVRIVGTNFGTVSNVMGKFQLENIVEDSCVVNISFIGYHTIIKTVTSPTTDSMYLFSMQPNEQELESVTIQAKRYATIQQDQAELSTINVTDLPLINVPRLFGEPDLIRIIQNLPGVKTESDFTGGFHVRGGRNDQNLILLDGVPVYNPWHALGIFSAFNTEAIDQVELTKGIYPAKYGGRLSSLLDITLQKGNIRNGAGYLTISPLSFSFSYGRPINQKTSYLVSVRRTYLEPFFWIANRVNNTSENYSDKYMYKFSDFNFKLVHELNKKSNVEAAVFLGNDQLALNSEGKYFQPNLEGEVETLLNDDLTIGWRNVTGSLKYLHEWANLSYQAHTFVTSYHSGSLLDSKADYGIGTGFDVSSQFSLDRTLEKEEFRQVFLDVGLRQDFTYILQKNINLQFGAEWMFHNLEQKNVIAKQEFGRSSTQTASGLLLNQELGDLQSLTPQELSIYASASLRMQNFSFFPGLRFHRFETAHRAFLLPRFNIRYDFNDAWYISAGYGHFNQNVQSISLDLVRVPNERWFWTDENRNPATAHTTTFGVGFQHNKLGKITLEGYYKETSGLINFSPQAQSEALGFEFLPQFGTETVSGDGESYGVELLWMKNIGILTGWIGYTWSRAWEYFPDLNNGIRFPSRTDRPHDLQLFMTYKLNSDWSIGALFN